MSLGFLSVEEDARSFVKMLFQRLTHYTRHCMARPLYLKGFVASMMNLKIWLTLKKHPVSTLILNLQRYRTISIADGKGLTR